MYGYIYKTTNILNGTIYIGKKKGNFDETYKGSGRYLRNALSKYGSENFSVEVIEYCEDLPRQNEREVYWIGYYSGLGVKMYNISRGGDGGDTYFMLSKEDRKKRCEKTGKVSCFHNLPTSSRYKAWETRRANGNFNFNGEKISGSLHKYYQSDEYRLRAELRKKKAILRKENALRKWISEKHTCERCGNVMTELYGSGRFCCKHCAVTHPHTEETKKLISELGKLGICGNKGKHLSQEHRENIGRANKGKVHTEEWRKRSSEAHKGQIAWNKGLTISDPRVAKYANSRRINKQNREKN